MRIDTLLRDEIQDEFAQLNKIEVGSETYKTTVDGLTKLVDRAIELEKIDVEMHEKAESQEYDRQLKEQQMVEEKKDRKVQTGIALAGVVLPLAVTIWGTLKSFKFEETGTVTTMMGRGFINKLLPRK